MEADVDFLLSDIAHSLRTRVVELTGALGQSLRDEVAEFWMNENLARLVPASHVEHINAWLDVLEHGFDVTKVEAPPSGIEFARLFAQRGGRLSVLLRGYRLSHANFLRVMYDEIARRTRDPDLINAATTVLNALGFEFIDRTSEHAVAAYQEERDRLVQRRLTMLNEASRRIGTTLEIARTAQELADVGTDGLADLVTVGLLDSVLRHDEAGPVPGPPVLRLVAQQSAAEKRSAPAPGTGHVHTYPEDSQSARALATGQPLLQPTSDDFFPWLPPDAQAAPFRRRVHSTLIVPLQASHGAPLGLAHFFRDRTEEPFDDEDLLLAGEITSRAAVHIDNARRYTHQRATALTLQRSLLPSHVTRYSALDTASRYLPAGTRAGVGGDWYDVIPLSGARVALVIGDVIGHGINAAATMGRLRTAVRTLADIDLAPDELLTHLDDVVIRLQHEEGQTEDEISATCLYAVYDPVSRGCSVASAGHLPPAVVTPREAAPGGPANHVADFPGLSIGPPLGLGGLPFETAQCELPEGTLLALYTDGLLHTPSRDVDAGLTLLRGALSHAEASLEETCDDVLAAFLPRQPRDDIALLLARTRCLHADRVASWDFSPDPAAVSDTRAFAHDQLATWGLEEVAFTTELIVSELVTNALRYGQEPIQLRLIHDNALTCEVSDGSSTAPHLRRARSYDEGGRGLFLVAQLSDRWGTRHTHNGKVIWAEQSLTGPDGPSSLT